MPARAKAASIASVVAGAAIHLTAALVWAQPKKPPGGEGLLSLIPAKAVFFLERRGHEAVRDAFLASNLGQMAQDEAVKQFVHDSRVRIGRMIVADMFDLKTDEDITAHQKLLHQVLKPFWYKPCAMYVVVEENLERAPGLGFICLPDEKYRKECSDALEALMKVGLPNTGRPGTRQAFTYSSGTLSWRGVAKDDEEFTLPQDREKQVEELKKRSLFMVNWTLPLLLVATDLSAADAVDAVMAGRAKAKDEDPSVKAVMAPTALKDWAFRWHFDAAALLQMLQRKLVEDDPQEPGPKELIAAFGLDRIRGAGGTCGYADNVYTRLTFIDAPGPAAGVLAAFKPGASYQQGLAMVPSGSVFCLAGQLDFGALMKLVAGVVARSAAGGRQSGQAEPPGTAPAKDDSELEPPSTAPAASPKPVAQPTSAAPTPATQPARALPEPAAKVFRQLSLLAEASGGNVGGFVVDLQAFVGGMFGEAGLPVGMVLDLKDRDKAVKAIDALVALARQDEQVPDEQGPGATARPKEYRKIPIRYLGEMARLAVLKDRLVVALGDTALKAAIDTALDSTGGFETGGADERLAKLAGEGSVIFKMDLAALTRLAWPLLMQMAAQIDEQFPFASLPSTDKMVRMLGPEIAVFQAVPGGLLLKSRGKIPFATKMVAGFPMAGAGLFWMMFH